VFLVCFMEGSKCSCKCRNTTLLVAVADSASGGVHQMQCLGVPLHKATTHHLHEPILRAPSPAG
jgi:hypothetical protein